MYANRLRRRSRDQRLWLGDLYLEALANNYSFKQYNLTKRCLYLLAGLSEHNGKLNATVLKPRSPSPRQNNIYMIILSCLALPSKTICRKRETETAEDLWRCKNNWNQLTNTCRMTEQWITNGHPVNGGYSSTGKTDYIEVAFHGVTVLLSKRPMNWQNYWTKENEVANFRDSSKDEKAARKHFYNPKRVYSQANWMIRFLMLPKYGWYWEKYLHKEAQRSLKAKKTRECLHSGSTLPVPLLHWSPDQKRNAARSPKWSSRILGRNDPQRCWYILGSLWS